MTNRDRLARMDNRELAEELCANHFYYDCSCCPAEEQCDYGSKNAPVGDGLIKWLEMEADKQDA